MKGRREGGWKKKGKEKQNDDKTVKRRQTYNTKKHTSQKRQDGNPLTI